MLVGPFRGLRLFSAAVACWLATADRGLAAVHRGDVLAPGLARLSDNRLDVLGNPDPEAGFRVANIGAGDRTIEAGDRMATRLGSIRSASPFRRAPTAPIPTPTIDDDLTASAGTPALITPGTCNVAVQRTAPNAAPHVIDAGSSLNLLGSGRVLAGGCPATPGAFRVRNTLDFAFAVLPTPEPASLLVWIGLACAARAALGRRRGGH